MEYTQEEYDQAPILATVKLMGTKRSRILNDEEEHIMTFNKYDIDHLLPGGSVGDHFNAISEMAAEKGDVLISYMVNGEDLVAHTIRNVCPTNYGDPWQLYPEICAALPSLRNCDPADGYEIVQIALIDTTSVPSDNQEVSAQDPGDVPFIFKTSS